MPEPRRAVRLVLRTNVWVAAAVASLGWWVANGLIGEPAQGSLGALFFGTLVVYNLDHHRDDRHRLAQDPAARPRLPRGLRAGLIVTASAGLIGSFILHPDLFLRAWPAGLLGLLYGARLPSGARLKELPGAKAWIVSAAVTQACVWLPLSPGGLPPGPLVPTVPSAQFLAVTGFVLALTALNAHCFDLRDIDVDQASGVRSWVTRRGPAASHRLLVLVAVGVAIAAAGCTAIGILDWAGPATLVTAAALTTLVRPGASRERFGLIVDGWLMLPAGFAALGLWWRLASSS